MKKIEILIAVISALFVFAGSATADQRTFPAGSLIIPMNSSYQGATDHGIFEAYGLMYALLDHKDTAGDPDPIPVFWCINPDKTSITDTDFSISTDTGVDPASEYDHAGSTNPINTGIYTNTDGALQIDYFGGPFVIDAAYADAAKTIIDNWKNVNIHVANAPFTADIGRVLDGVPPKIALLNDTESHTNGNAVTILAGYLEIAGIGSGVYDVVTPDEVGGIATTVDGVSVPAGNGILEEKDADGKYVYDLLWAPHWTAYKDYGANAKKIISKIGDFLDRGGALFAECASIMNFEYHPNDAGSYNVGPWLTTNDISHNGGTNNAADIIVADPTIPFTQTGDFAFGPEGGHLHNWEPYNTSNSGYFDASDFSYGVPVAPPDSDYNATVQRLIYDTTGWDYYVAGYKDGDDSKGFISYLGGHTYVDCTGGGPGGPKGGPGGGAVQNAHEFKFEFKDKVDDPHASFTIHVDYNDGGTSESTEITFSKGDDFATGDPLEIDLSSMKIKDKTIEKVFFNNKGTNTITLTHFKITFTKGGKLKKVEDKVGKDTTNLLDSHDGIPSVTSFDTNDVLAASSGAGTGGGTPLSSCTYKNVAGIRYVLNTVLDLQAYVNYKEFMKSSPVMDLADLDGNGEYNDLIAYYGSFDYPGYTGHLRALKVKDDGSFTELWDAANKIPSNRTLYTAIDDSDGDSRVDDRINLEASATFLALNDSATGQTINEILNVTPSDGTDTDEISLLNNVISKDLGGIIHSSPAVVGPSPFVDPDRPIVIYAGSADGMLHAFTGSTGAERWAFLPHNLLGKLYGASLLQDTDMPTAVVDASPTVADMMVDRIGSTFDGNKQRRTILLSAEGSGNHYVFAMDISDPDDPQPWWEATATNMGYAYRTSMGHIKVCDVNDNCEVKAAAFVSTNYQAGTGIQVYAFDLETGDEFWSFGQSYGSTSNEIPDAPVLVDKDGDGVIDSVLAADMEGRLWQLDAATGKSLYGTTESPQPVYQVNVGGTTTGYPIGSSPAVYVCDGGHVLVFFGTGGADFASDSNSGHIIGIDITNGAVTSGGTGELFNYTLDVGEKLYASPIVTKNAVIFGTAFGDRETTDPNSDISDSQSGKIHIVKPVSGDICYASGCGGNGQSDYNDSSHEVVSDVSAKVTGSYAEGNQVILGTMDGKIIRFGKDKEDGNNLAPSERVNIEFWRDF
ncbi:MAG: PQQ-binding-like beta-propeller repeat protein [Deltaproteobacteria bacterium]|nr:PQQ-binding-like beta-propeller repeat protein [Deltaproteobacteria bacterium]